MNHSRVPQAWGHPTKKGPGTAPEARPLASISWGTENILTAEVRLVWTEGFNDVFSTEDSHQLASIVWMAQLPDISGSFFGAGTADHGAAGKSNG